MYYNIKIKSEGSEFSLNSSNKEITQREMDIYFACIFNASNEFKSRIKKIEINNDSVKSINELEVINNKNNAASIEDSSVQNHDKTPQIIAIESQEQTEATQNENIVSNKSLQIENTQTIPENEIPVPPIPSSPVENDFKPDNSKKLQDKNTYSEIKIEDTQIQTCADNTVHVFNKVKIENPNTQINDEIKIQNSVTKNTTIDELISIAQDKISEVDLLKNNTNDSDLIDVIKESTEPAFGNSINTETNTVEFTPKEKVEESVINREEEQKERELFESKNQTMINDIFFNDDSKTSKEEIKQELPGYSQSTEEQTVQLIQTPVSLDEYEENIQLNQTQYDFEITTPTTQTPVSLEVIEDTLAPALEQSVAQQSQNENISLDFSVFLKGFVVNKTTDEFLICAYYIKNILKQNNFTMKFINAKLFQATGKIADMSIVDELIQKEYIKTIDIEDSKKYCITSNGENYFASTFQG